MVSTFFERIDFLAEQVGHGTLQGKVEVDQVYAHYQHEGTEFKHPRGGKAHYLRDPLFEKADERMGKLAERFIMPEGSQIDSAMIDAMEALSKDVFDQAPREFGDLRASGHPSVRSDGAVIYDRAPYVHRLTEDEIRAKHEVRRLFPLDEHEGRR